MNATARTLSAESRPARLPLGRRNPADIAATVRRVTGKDQAPTLDVAAFQSFAD